MLRLLVLLSPLGAVLALGLASLTTYDVLVEIAALMETSRDVEFSNLHIMGVVGLVLFGIGIVCAALSHCPSGELPKMLLASAAIAFVSACLLVGYGTFELLGAFKNLATAETVAPDMLLADARGGRLPLLAGWSCVCIGGGLVAAASLMRSQDLQTRPGRPSVVIASFSVIVFVAAALLSARSLQSLEVTLQGTHIEPARIAVSFQNLIFATLLSLIGIAGCGLVCVLMAIRRPPAAEAVDAFG